MLLKIKNIIFGIIYFLVIVYLAIYIPCLWGSKPLVIMSGSMEPILKVGGILYYEEIDLNDFKDGDILVYQTKEHIISHRIVDVIDDSFITKGDANNTFDSNLVNGNQVLGRGTNWSIPYIGYYADFIYNHKYLLYISLGLIIVDIWNDIYKQHKKKEGAKFEKST